MKWSRRIPHLAELRYCRLRQANVMLEWADALYRSNETTSMARARELYKGVLWLHGKVPPICPTWPQRIFGGGGTGTVFHPSGVPSTYEHHTENPALVSQTTRAYRGIYGFTMSSLHPDPALPPLPASPLNAFADINPEQAFTLAISKPANPGVDFHRVTDVVLAIEYEASLV